VKAVADMINTSDIEGIKKYLSDTLKQIPDNELHYYCSNPVLNSLLGSYAERCAKLNIKLNILLDLPETLSIPNYELCIIIGNLLENAAEACEKLPEGSGKIDLITKTQNRMLTIMVENTYDGDVTIANGQFLSKKKNGGFGLRSVRAVSDRHNGNMHIKRDPHSFAVYVMLNTTHNPPTT
jgi:sensor histidine kinase regulating citrate/malate metabolism